MTSKEFTNISNHEGICISLPYYSSAKDGKLELKVIVHVLKRVNAFNGLSMMIPIAERFHLFSPPEESGKYWNKLQMTLIPKSSALQTKVEVKHLLHNACLVAYTQWIVPQNFKLLPMRHIFFDLVISFITNRKYMLSFVFSRSDCQLTI